MSEPNKFFRTTRRPKKLEGCIFFGIIDCDFLLYACLGLYDVITTKERVFQI